MTRTLRRILISVVLVMLAAPAAAQDIERAKKVMRDVAARCPRAYANAHANGNTHPERLDFIILAAQALKREDPRVGMNGKRGNANDPSSDAIAYGSGRDVLVIDVIARAGEHGTDPDAIVWQDVTPFGPGVYIDPDGHRPSVACGEPLPPQGPFPGGAWEARHAEVLLRFAGSATTQTVAEQLAHLWPDEGWGQKAAAVGRPVSDNVIARRYPDGRLVGFQVVPASAHPMQYDLAGQHFVPVAGVDHLGMGASTGGGTGGETGGGTGGSTGGETVPPATNLQPLLDAIAALAEKVEALEGTIQGFGTSVLPALARIEQVLDAQPTTPPSNWPEYVGSILGRTVVLSPRAPR